MNCCKKIEPSFSIGVVILNYCDYHSTILCVNSFLDCYPKPKHIVIVDNASPNRSYLILSKLFEKNNIITVINSGFNKGYSYGNNAGIRYLRRFSIKNIIIATSDTEVVSKDIIEQIKNSIGPDVGLIGPRIISGKVEQNPSIEQLSFRYLLSLIWKQYLMPYYNLQHILSKIFNSLVSRMNQILISKNNYNDNYLLEEVYMLHGSFIIITDTFIRRNGLLDEALFMFREEDLLSWNCETSKLKRLFLKSAMVKHIGDNSIMTVHGRSSSGFVAANQIKSGIILRKKIKLRKIFLVWVAKRFLGA